ncbi:hypothetical protein WA026_005898 [Henosepilachna vigintioctopunctata]|uniref:Uncharacterized protein n=1 Tax=Henosepilachna vigintioctopunctata TaxID=420089 RepID=A0AAW1TWH4_9CUCU
MWCTDYNNKDYHTFRIITSLVVVILLAQEATGFVSCSPSPCKNGGTCMSPLKGDSFCNGNVTSLDGREGVGDSAVIDRSLNPALHDTCTVVHTCRTVGQMLNARPRPDP